MIIKAIEKSFKRKAERGWPFTFWAIDLHETVLLPNWSDETPEEFYPLAESVLKKLSSRGDIKLIMYTCSWPDEIKKYLNFFESRGIKFDYVNTTPDLENTTYGFYRDKPYFNVLLDDKAGFDPYTDWPIIDEALNKF